MPTSTTSLGEALLQAREETLALVAPFSNDLLERVIDPLMSPLAWDLGHIAAYEDLWLVRNHGDQPLLRGDLADLYDAFETPRAVRGDIPFLRGSEVYEYLAAVRERALEVLDHAGPGDGTVHEMVARHEGMHNETMRQTLFLGDLEGGRPDWRGAPDDTAEAWIDVPAGPFQMGAPGGAFAFDNERPRHAVDVPAFAIARLPVTNAAWSEFVAAGGYERRELWTDDGWAWTREHGVTQPQDWRDGEPPVDAARPVQHVSWFEADAFARFSGARLPTEAEWEKAATLDGEPVRGIGSVWEWTASHFGGYPGFVAHPYREYSEVFFGDGFRVLRGSSWATADRVRSLTFRNWDLPLRRQIFTGVRLAREA